MKKKVNKQTQESGQSLVELALSLTVILMLLTGAVEFGLGLFQYVTMRDAAQEGALYGSINPGADGTTAGDAIEQRAIAAASDVMLLTPDDILVEINGDDCEGLTSGTPNSISVTITFAHPITMPFVSAMIGSNTINLGATVTDTILQPACTP